MNTLVCKIPYARHSSQQDSTGCAENAIELLRRANTPKKQELLFASWDTDRDGIVEFADLRRGLLQLQPSSDEIHVEFVAEAALKALPALDTPDNQR